MTAKLHCKTTAASWTFYSPSRNQHQIARRQFLFRRTPLFQQPENTIHQLHCKTSMSSTRPNGASAYTLTVHSTCEIKQNCVCRQYRSDVRVERINQSRIDVTTFELVPAGVPLWSTK